MIGKFFKIISYKNAKSKKQRFTHIPGSGYMGSIDFVDTCKLYGWVAKFNDEKPVEISVYADLLINNRGL